MAIIAGIMVPHPPLIIPDVGRGQQVRIKDTVCLLYTSNLDSRDVAIGISYSGSSKNTVDVMKLAKKKGAATIAITNFEHSLIAGYADILLCTSSQQLL